MDLRGVIEPRGFRLEARAKPSDEIQISTGATILTGRSAGGWKRTIGSVNYI